VFQRFFEKFNFLKYVQSANARYSAAQNFNEKPDIMADKLLRLVQLGVENKSLFIKSNAKAFSTKFDLSVTVLCFATESSAKD